MFGQFRAQETLWQTSGEHWAHPLYVNVYGT